ncbi:MAG: helix-turn-helix domain-containing protein [Candidatus Limnocylindrales bacterium]
MPRSKRTNALVEAELAAAPQAAVLGRELRQRRKRRRLTQASLATLVGLKASREGELERGRGATATLRTWHALFGALGAELRIIVRADPLDEPVDAGHLAIQELLLRLARALGRTRRAELPTRPADPHLSSDVVVVDVRHRCLILQEAWNTFGDLGAAARSTNRKAAEAEALAVALAGDAPPLRVATCWVVRATRRNVALVRRYPEFFAARFPGPSRLWVEALVGGAAPPVEPGLLWFDPAPTRLYAWRRRGD